MLPGWRQFLHFTRDQRRGIGLLFLVFLGLLALLYWDARHYNPPPSAVAQADSLYQVWEEHQRKQDSLYRSRLRPFDPHQVSPEYLERTGLASGIARRIMQFRQGGGHFYQARDLLKIYGMDTAWFRRVRRFIRLPQANSRSKSSYTSKSKKNYDWRAFDPNSVSSADLEAMGLASWQAGNILSYRQKYRPFRQDSDLYEVYGLDSSLVTEMLPYLEITPDSLARDTARPQAKRDSVYPINLNKADSATLLRVQGIGKYTAGQILEKRRQWKGFHSLEQLMDIYPIDSARLKKIKPQLFCDTSYPRYNLNALSLEELQELPYLNYSIARSIIGFRNEFRSYREIDELQNIRMVDSVLFFKLSPYLYISSKDKEN